MARDDADLLDIVSAIRGVPGVLGTDTTAIVDTTKWVYAPGFPEAGA